MTLCKNCFTPLDAKPVPCSTCGAGLHKGCVNKAGDKVFCDACNANQANTTQQELTDVPSVIRRSYIDTYRNCPTKFYYEVIKNIPSPQTIYTQLGIDLHTLFDKASQKYIPSTRLIEEFEAIFAAYPDELFGEVSKVKMYNRGMNSIDNFYKVIADLPEPLCTEQTIQFSIGEDLPIVQTTSDRIHMVDGELEMLDWKTGTVMVGQKLSSDIQAPLYIYGAMQHFQKPVRSFTFYYLDEGKVRTFNRTQNMEYVCEVNKRSYYININDTLKEVQHIFSQIKKSQFNVPRDIKKMFYHCKMCHLRDNQCQGADIQAWRQYNGR